MTYLEENASAGLMGGYAIHQRLDRVHTYGFVDLQLDWLAVRRPIAQVAAKYLPGHLQIHLGH